ncbi:hypothetical protein ANN_20139 [Periplaneta americana]|uniref:Uncharacterized protein n=1 Tax=Periplaneta americana TaxID=6978 RepID=A0ABQ8SCF9_PERAM|nr:hypothetical protein ANN_20139 [Periplaneta americana]
MISVFRIHKPVVAIGCDLNSVLVTSGQPGLAQYSRSALRVYHQMLFGLGRWACSVSWIQLVPPTLLRSADVSPSSWSYDIMFNGVANRFLVWLFYDALPTTIVICRLAEMKELLRCMKTGIMNFRYFTFLLVVRTKGWIVEEEISCLAENGSTRRADILAYNADTKQGIIVDPTIRFEVGCHQSAEVHLEKKSIYEPTVNYFKLKYALIHVEVCITLYDKKCDSRFHIQFDDVLCSKSNLLITTVLHEGAA